MDLSEDMAENATYYCPLCGRKQDMKNESIGYWTCENCNKHFFIIDMEGEKTVPAQRRMPRRNLVQPLMNPVQLPPMRRPLMAPLRRPLRAPLRRQGRQNINGGND